MFLLQVESSLSSHPPLQWREVSSAACVCPYQQEALRQIAQCHNTHFWPSGTHNTHSALLCVFKGVTTICGRLFLPQDKKLNKVLFISQVGLNDRSARYKIRVVRSSIHIYLKHEKKHESTSEAILFQLKKDVNTHRRWRMENSASWLVRSPVNQTPCESILTFYLTIISSYLGLLTIFLDITILSKSEVSLCISHTFDFVSWFCHSELFSK